VIAATGFKPLILGSVVDCWTKCAPLLSLEKNLSLLKQTTDIFGCLWTITFNKASKFERERERKKEIERQRDRDRQRDGRDSKKERSKERKKKRDRDIVRRREIEI
jgi:hypothetical protein